MLGLSLSLLNWFGVLTLFPFLKLESGFIPGSLSEVSLYLYKFAIHPFINYCGMIAVFLSYCSYLLFYLFSHPICVNLGRRLYKTVSGVPKNSIFCQLMLTFSQTFLFQSNSSIYRSSVYLIQSIIKEQRIKEHFKEQVNAQDIWVCSKNKYSQLHYM